MGNCEICGVPKEYRPAGVNKQTGKPFDAFYSCPNWKVHKQNGQKPTSTRPTTPVQKFTASLDQDNVDQKFKKIREEKTESIRWMNALNNACLLIAHGKAEKLNLEAVANFIYGLEPRQNDKTAPTGVSSPLKPQDAVQPQKSVIPQSTGSEPMPEDFLSDVSFKD